MRGGRQVQKDCASLLVLMLMRVVSALLYTLGEIFARGNVPYHGNPLIDMDILSVHRHKMLVQVLVVGLVN